MENLTHDINKDNKKIEIFIIKANTIFVDSNLKEFIKK